MLWKEGPNYCLQGEVVIVSGCSCLIGQRVLLLTETVRRALCCEKRRVPIETPSVFSFVISKLSLLSLFLTVSHFLDVIMDAVEMLVLHSFQQKKDLQCHVRVSLKKNGNAARMRSVEVRCAMSSPFSHCMKYRVFDDKSRASEACRPLGLRHWIFCFLAILLLLLIAREFFSRRPQPYDRSSDKERERLVYRSREARELPTEGSLFCWALTTAKYHDSRALAVNETWLSRCDHGELFTNAPFHPEQHIPHSTVFAGIRDDYEALFWKTRFALRFIFNNISSNFEWYIKADDDTYVIVENLRRYLARFNPDEPHYLGYRLKPSLEHGFNGGGGGYVLSRAAMKIFNEQLYANESLCPENPYEDVGIAKCLASLGIFPEDTRTADGKQRFNTFGPDEVYAGTVADGHPEKWIFDWPSITVTTFMEEVHSQGLDAFSSELISLHHLSPKEIRLMEALLYRVRQPPASHDSSH